MSAQTCYHKIKGCNSRTAIHFCGGTPNHNGPHQCDGCRFEWNTPDETAQIEAREQHMRAEMERSNPR